MTKPNRDLYGRTVTKIGDAYYAEREQRGMPGRDIRGPFYSEGEMVAELFLEVMDDAKAVA